MALLNEKAEEGRDRLLEFNSQNKKLSGELLAEAQKMDSDKELLPFAFDMLERLDIDVQEGFYPDSFVIKGAPEQPEHATLLGTENIHSSENGEISESDGCSITVITNREKVLNYENVEFFHWEHPVMQRLFDRALSDDFGNAACVLCNLVPAQNIFIQYNFILEFVINSHWGVNNLLGERLLSVILDNNGNLQNALLEHLNSAELKNSKAVIPHSILEYFKIEGFKTAKNSLKELTEKIAEDAKKTVLPTLENDLHRLEETYALLRDFELGKLIDKKRKDIIACKKSLETPNLRLDAVRILCAN
jgi:ATP-dependent helicase HepA